MTTHEEALRLCGGPTFGKHKKRQSMQDIRTSSATRECVAFVCDFGRCIVYTHMVAHMEIDTVTQTKHFPKM